MTTLFLTPLGVRGPLSPRLRVCRVCDVRDVPQHRLYHANSKASPRPLIKTAISCFEKPRPNLSKALAIAAASVILTASQISAPCSATDMDIQPAPLNAEPHYFSNPQTLDSYSAHSALKARWDVHSIDSRTETLLVFSNDSSSVVDLWWIDYCGREVYYASINPGTTHMQPSFATHPWVVRDHLSQNSVLVLIATQHPLLAVVKSI